MPPWQELDGGYTVFPGTDSLVQPGFKKGLPLLSTDVGAFTRFWLGIQTARGLSITDNFCAYEELTLFLDEHVRLPKPAFDLDF